MFLINAEQFFLFSPEPNRDSKTDFYRQTPLLFAARHVQPQIKSTWSAASRPRFAPRFHARGMIPVSLAGRQHVRAPSLPRSCILNPCSPFDGRQLLEIVFLLLFSGHSASFLLEENCFLPTTRQPPPASFLVTRAQR